MPEVWWIDNTSAVEVWRTLGTLFRRFQLWQNTQKSCHKTEKQENKRKLVNHPEKTNNWVCGADIFIKREGTKITDIKNDRESVIFFHISKFCSTFFIILLKSLCFLSKLRMCWHLQHLSDRSCDKLKSTSNSRCPFDSYIINIIANTIFIIILHIIKINIIMFYYQKGDHKDEIITGQEFKSPCPALSGPMQTKALANIEFSLIRTGKRHAELKW